MRSRETSEAGARSKASPVSRTEHRAESLKTAATSSRCNACLDSKTCGILGVARPPGRAPATPPGGASRPATDAARPRTPRRLGSRSKLHLHN